MITLTSQWTQHCKLTLYFLKPQTETGFKKNESQQATIKVVMGSMRIFSFGKKRASRRIKTFQTIGSRIVAKNQWYEFLLIGYNAIQLRDLQQISFVFEETRG